MKLQESQGTLSKMNDVISFSHTFCMAILFYQMMSFWRGRGMLCPSGGGGVCYVFLSHCAALWLVCVGKCLLDSLPPRQECLPAFLHWLDENNVEHGSLKLEEIPGKGWGIVTTKDFNVCMYTCACDAHLRSVCLCVCDAHLPSVRLCHLRTCLICGFL